MVYDTYNELVNGIYKPTYNWGAPHCRYPEKGGWTFQVFHYMNPIRSRMNTLLGPYGPVKNEGPVQKQEARKVSEGYSISMLVI